MQDIVFGPGSVPVAVAARVYGKDANWIRAGIVTGYLDIGTATRRGKGTFLILMIAASTQSSMIAVALDGQKTQS